MWVGAKRLGDHIELDHVDPTHTVLNQRNDGLSSADAARQLRLCKAGGLAGVYKHLDG